eukprot:3736591-Alexandrium_andersonii.AAC.1
MGRNNNTLAGLGQRVMCTEAHVQQALQPLATVCKGLLRFLPRGVMPPHDALENPPPAVRRRRFLV